MNDADFAFEPDESQLFFYGFHHKKGMREVVGTTHFLGSHGSTDSHAAQQL